MYTLMVWIKINGCVAQKNKGVLGRRKALIDITNSGKPSVHQPSKKHNTKNVVGGSVTAYLYHLWVVEADGGRGGWWRLMVVGVQHSDGIDILIGEYNTQMLCT
ncbi:hypothetical protein Hdeb2414_s0006g00221021 [Helianthus debilis subsp. tardiflorus]